MKKILPAIFLILSFSSYCQKGKFNPFKLIVLKPDTAIIDRSLRNNIDSVEAEYIRSYYKSVQEMERFASSTYLLNDTEIISTQHKRKTKLLALKAREPDVKKFKYFQTLSFYSTEVYNFYFNEYAPFSTIVEKPFHKTDIESLKRLTDSANADYIVFFTNVHSVIRQSRPYLKLTTSLYSKKEGKIILTKETEGDTDSRGDMWTCEGNTLRCLLVNGVRTSTDEVAPVIAKIQMKKQGR